MTRTGEFLAATVEVLSKRAALQCSNPECGVLTSGPTVDISGSINIGEAAHIYGRAEGTTRYDSAMTPTERADITNGIWLCRNCHKEVDNDEKRFPAALLFEWRRAHERAVLGRLGRKGDIIRDKLRTDRLKAFESASYLAQQIVLDKPPYWEHKLTAELLRSELGPVHVKWRQLQDGLYNRKSALVSFDHLSDWYGAKFEDAVKIVTAVKQLVEVEIAKSWGDPGIPGNEAEILDICRLIVSAAKNLLEWEEDIRFSYVPRDFRDLQFFLQGVAGKQLEEILRIPSELSKIFDVENPSGSHHIQLIFNLPDNFPDEFSTIFRRCYESYVHNRA